MIQRRLTLKELREDLAQIKAHIVTTPPDKSGGF